MAAIKRKQDDKTKSSGHKKSKSSTAYGKPSSKDSKKSKKPIAPKNLVEESDDSDDDDDDSSISSEEAVTPDEMEDFEDNTAPVNAEDVMDETGDTTTHPDRNGLISSTKSRDAHAAQKKLVLERKQAKPNADVLHRSKKIWERLRLKSHVPAEERTKLTNELFSMITGRVHELVFKHDASRVIQTAVKYGSAQRRQDIAKELKGGYVELAQSNYGKYLVVKLMHYGKPETREMIVNEFMGHVRKLVKHREACFVIDDAYSQYATAKQKAALVREFYGVEYALFKEDTPNASLDILLEKSPDKRQVIMKSLFELISQVVEKNATFLNILHKAMLEYIKNAKPDSDSNEITEFIELIKEHVPLIAFTKDGAQVVMRCLAWGSAKDRKVLVKNLKPKAADLYGDEHGYMVLLTMFDVVDDTVLVSKTIFPEIQAENGLMDAALHKYARIPLLYPLAGRERRLLTPAKCQQLEEIDVIRAQTSKKDPQIRQGELRKAISPILLKAVAENAELLSQDTFGTQFITEVLISADGDKTAALEAVAALASSSRTTEESATGKQGLYRVFKLLVQNGFFNNKEKKLEVSSQPLDFHKYLIPQIENNLIDWATGEGAFVIVSLLESETVPSDVKVTLKKELSKPKNSKALKTAESEGNKGAAIIIGLLN